MKKRKEKEKKEKEGSSYFQIKGIHPKERVMIQGVQKYLELGSYTNSTHLHVLI
jgi:hypothetical protein